jgi:Ca2+/Na+ antiporter
MRPWKDRHPAHAVGIGTQSKNKWIELITKASKGKKDADQIKDRLSLHPLRYVPFALIACFVYFSWPLSVLLWPLILAMLLGYLYVVIVLRRLDREDAHNSSQSPTIGHD